MDNRDFGWALNMMRCGKRVYRSGWNGKKDQWICLVEGHTAHGLMGDGWRQEFAEVESQPYIAMWTAEGKWQPGWLASQADMLAEDWDILD